MLSQASWADEPELEAAPIAQEAQQQRPPRRGLAPPQRGGSSGGGRRLAAPPRRPDDAETKAMLAKLQETSERG